MTAVDIAVQTKLLGADEVTIAYRRGQDRMNASEYEQHLAQTNGVKIMTIQPKALRRKRRGHRDRTGTDTGSDGSL
jgi:dihydropyrimidine dehydrogenase (NAD+) subunit PreT